MTSPTSTIGELYAHACRTPSDIYEHLPTFVDLCHRTHATKVIELGVRGGVSTLAWLHGLAANDGHLWSVDVNPAPGLPTGRWTFRLGDDCHPDVLADLPDQVDVVFIDTSHAYDHTVNELALYEPKLRPGGRFVLHDTELRQPDSVTGPDFPVKTAIGEFCDARGLTWTNHPNCYGLGIIHLAGDD